MTPLRTQRLVLRPFTQGDLGDFTRLHSDPQTMRDYGMTLSAEQSAEKLETYLDGAAQHGMGRMHVSDADGFIGYVGINQHDDPTHPLGPHREIGWRLLPHAWGKGYANEAARAVLLDAFTRLELDHLLAMTAPDNLASQAVMTRLGLERLPDLDYTEDDPLLGPWHGLVWRAAADQLSTNKSDG